MKLLRILAFAPLGIGLAVPQPLAAQQPRGAKVVILSPSETDARIELTREAISFWNQTFKSLGLEPVLATTEVVVASPSSRAFENYSRLVWQRAGRVHPGSHEPAPPREITDLDGDVIVFLSQQGLMPFAWPIPDGGRYFIAIADLQASTMDPANSHNVIAHEIGHAVGLSHGDDPDALMCLPCRPGAVARPSVFLPLTAADQKLLLKLYSSARGGNAEKHSIPSPSMLSAPRTARAGRVRVARRRAPRPAHSRCSSVKSPGGCVRGRVAHASHAPSSAPKSMRAEDVLRAHSEARSRDRLRALGGKHLAGECATSTFGG